MLLIIWIVSVLMLVPHSYGLFIFSPSIDILTSMDMFASIAENLINFTFNVRLSWLDNGSG